jgi:hypothetical protein
MSGAPTGQSANVAIDGSLSTYSTTQSSPARVMAADALPVPMTMVRPRGEEGRNAGTRCAGCAVSITAANIALSNRSTSSPDAATS